MTSARWHFKVLPGQRVVEALTTWWNSLHETYKNESVQEIPWSSVLPVEARRWTRSTLINLEPIRWRERAAGYEFVLLYENTGDDNFSVIGLRSITSTADIDQIYVLPRTKRASNETFVQRKYVRASYVFQTPSRPPPPSNHIYPLSSTWTDMSISYRHLWALDPHAFELRPRSHQEESGDVVDESTEALWVRRILSVYHQISLLMLEPFDESFEDMNKHFGHAKAPSLNAESLPTAIPPAIDDYNTFGSRACQIIRSTYFVAPLPLTTPAELLAEWKARLYTQLWVCTVSGDVMRTLMMRVQRLALFSILSCGWYRETHIAALISHGHLPVEMWRALDTKDIGSVAGTWWHTLSCEEISWDTALQHVKATVGSSQRIVVPPPATKTTTTTNPPSKRPSGVKLDDTRVVCVQGAAQTALLVTPYYQQMISAVCSTPVVTDDHFSSTPYFKVARSAFLLQPRTHCVVWSARLFHCVSVERAGMLYSRDATEIRGQVQIEGIPFTLAYVLTAENIEAAQATRASPLELANHIHQLFVHNFDAGVATPPMLVPCTLSNLAAPQTCSKWIVVWPSVVAFSIEAARTLSPLNGKARLDIEWRGKKLSLSSPHCNGAIWPLDPLFVRLHPAPEASWVTDTLRRYALQQFIGNPIASPCRASASPSLGVNTSLRTNNNRFSFAPPVSVGVRANNNNHSANNTICLLEDDQWSYRDDVVRHAVLKRLSLFHKQRTCQDNPPPSCAYIVRLAPILEHDPTLASCRMKHHAVLLYTDIHRWVVSLHMAHCAQLARRQFAAGTTLHTMQKYARDEFRPTLLLIQRRVNEIVAHDVPQKGATLGQRLIKNCALSAMRTLESTMTANFAEAYLTEAVFKRPPKAIREGGALLAYGDQGSRTIWIAGERFGQWMDWRSRTGSRGLLGYVANELWNDRKRMVDAYHHAVAWLSTVEPARVAQLTVVDPEDSAAVSNSVPLLAQHQLKYMMDNSSSLSKDDYFRRYLTETRCLGPLPQALLDQWYDTSVVVALPSTKYYIERGVPPHPCSALLVSMFDQHGQLNKIQTTYLTANTRKPEIAPRKLDYTYNGVSMPAKKTRNVQQTPAAFAPLFSSDFDDAPILLAEGLETALSAWMAFPSTHVFSSAGVMNWARFDYTEALPEAKLVVLCCDNDTGAGAQATTRAVAKAKQELANRGYDVREARPLPEYGDFNDVYRAMPGQMGTTAVHEMIVRQVPELSEYSFDNVSVPSSPFEMDDAEMIAVAESLESPQQSNKRTTATLYDEDEQEQDDEQEIENGTAEEEEEEEGEEQEEENKNYDIAEEEEDDNPVDYV